MSLFRWGFFWPRYFFFSAGCPWGPFALLSANVSALECARDLKSTPLERQDSQDLLQSGKDLKTQREWATPRAITCFSRFSGLPWVAKNLSILFSLTPLWECLQMRKSADWNKLLLLVVLMLKFSGLCQSKANRMNLVFPIVLISSPWRIPVLRY